MLNCSQEFSNHEIDVEMMISKDKDFLESIKSINGFEVDDLVLAKMMEESGSTFGDIVDALIKTYVAKEYNLEL